MASSATVPTRAEADLFAAAKATGARMSRSAAQQFNYWARLGKELEASHVLGIRDIEQVLEGRAAYDDLPATSQAIARVALHERADRARLGLDLAAEFAASGDTWVEADEHGNVVIGGRSEDPEGADTAEP